MEENLLQNMFQGTTGKTKASYSIDSKVLNEFDKICTSKKMKKSRVVENLIKIFNEQQQNLFGVHK